VNRRIPLLVAWLVVAACGVSDDPAPVESGVVRPESTASPGSELVELRFRWALPYLLEGERRYLAVEAIDDRGKVRTDIEPRWESLDPDLLSIDQDGEVVGVAPGEAKVRATLKGLEATLTVDVASSVPAWLELSASFLSIDWLAESRIHARLYNDSNIEVAGDVEWWSADPGVATVTDDGLVRGVARGSATIHASSAGLHAKLHVEVVDPMPTRLEIRPSDVTLEEGGLTRLQVAAFAFNGVEVMATPTWTSSDESIAAVEQNTGRLKAIGTGTATVTATAGRVSDSISVEVVEPTPD
jgi:hypothetical protein